MLHDLVAVLACLSVAQGNPPPEAQAEAAARLDSRGHIDRFARVAPGLYRGAQPSDAGLDLLVQHGVETVIDLRTSEKGARREREACVERGLKYLWLPLKPSEAPDSETIRKILSLTTQDAASPVFVHCRHGKDRTGLVVATYRMVMQDWDLAMALDEMDAFDYSRWWRDMRTWVKSVPGRTGELAP